MPSFADMMQIYNAPAEPRIEDTPPEREPWDVLVNRWPDFHPPAPEWSLEWIWAWVLLEPLPSSLDPASSPVAKHVSYERWRRIESCFEHGDGLPDDRLAWLREHEAMIRPLLEQEKAEHFRRYPPRR